MRGHPTGPPRRPLPAVAQVTLLSGQYSNLLHKLQVAQVDMLYTRFAQDVPYKRKTFEGENFRGLVKNFRGENFSESPQNRKIRESFPLYSTWMGTGWDRGLILAYFS